MLTWNHLADEVVASGACATPNLVAMCAMGVMPDGESLGFRPAGSLWSIVGWNLVTQAAAG